MQFALLTGRMYTYALTVTYAPSLTLCVVYNAQMHMSPLASATENDKHYSEYPWTEKG